MGGYSSVYSIISSISPPTFFIDSNQIFDVTKKKSKELYALLVRKKAQFSNIAYKLQKYFNFPRNQLRLLLSFVAGKMCLPHRRSQTK